MLDHIFKICSKNRLKKTSCLSSKLTHFIYYRIWRYNSNTAARLTCFNDIRPLHTAVQLFLHVNSSLWNLKEMNKIILSTFFGYFFHFIKMDLLLLSHQNIATFIFQTKKLINLILNYFNRVWLVLCYSGLLYWWTSIFYIMKEYFCRLLLYWEAQAGILFWCCSFISCCRVVGQLICTVGAAELLIVAYPGTDPTVAPGAIYVHVVVSPNGVRLCT